MRELLVTSIELFAYLLGTAALAIAGAFAEWSSLSYYAAGNHMFAAWLILIGGIFLYAAFSVGSDKLLPHLRDVTA